jgi:hypothetical protein
VARDSSASRVRTAAAPRPDQRLECQASGLGAAEDLVEAREGEQEAERLDVAGRVVDDVPPAVRTARREVQGQASVLAVVAEE